MPSKPIKIYLDTSVPSFLLASGDPNKQLVTKEFFRKVRNEGEYEVFVSTMVAQEIEETPDVGRKDFLKKIIEKYPVLEVTGKCLRLANRYVSEGLFTENNLEDAIHLATASIYNLDVVVSWNFRHIVRLKTKHGVTGINTLLGIKVPDIISPEELL